MTAIPARPTALIVRALAAFASALALASCGGGGVSANPSPIVDSATLSILPGSAVMYPGLPTTFVLSGGTGAYIIASSNQAVIPVAGGVTGRSVTLVPNPVTADTSVVLTVRDTGSAAPVSATVTVKQGTLNNDLTITPSSTQDSSCNPAICSGGDATVKVTVSQGGIPLAARGVRFEAVTGDYRFITTPTGVVPEVLSTFVDVATDETGVARARIRVTALAPNQTALVRVTDLATGAWREAAFPIVQYTGNTPAYFVLPSSLEFTGAYKGVCPSNYGADVSIFGGTPPYNVSGGSSAFFVSPSVVTTNGGKFTVVLPTLGSCGSSVIGVTDAVGRTVSVSVTTKEGTADAPAPAVTLNPTALTVRCGQNASFVVVGGDSAAVLSASTDHPRIVVTSSGRAFTVTRLNADGGVTYPATSRITVTDGATAASLTVSIVDALGVAATTCP